MKILTTLRYIDYGPRLWQLTRDFRWTHGGREFVARAGFVLDFYSVLRLLRWFRQQNQGIRNSPAAIHDHLVRHRKLLEISLMECHSQFRAAMKLVGVNLIVRNLKYLTVVALNWLKAGPGDGTPPDNVLSALAAHGEDWRMSLPLTPPGPDFGEAVKLAFTRSDPAEKVAGDVDVGTK